MPFHFSLQMDSQQSWTDFHSLNAAFNDVVEATTERKEWIQASLVRLFYRGNMDKDKAASRTVKVLDGLTVEYAVPFPLTYIIQPHAINAYGEIFVFLLQIRRAKVVLEHVHVRGVDKGKKWGVEMKIYYAMGSRLSWSIKWVPSFAICIHCLWFNLARF